MNLALGAALMLGLGAVTLLGMTITITEFSTALPYLGAVAILNNAGLTAVAARARGVQPRLRLAAPVATGRLPPVRRAPAAGARAVEGESAGRETLLWILGIAGFLLLADGLRYFELCGLV